MIHEESIGIVTVLYNSTRHLDIFIESLLLNKEAIGEVTFIDNGSHDNPETVLKKLDGIIPYSLVKNTTNVGYSKGVNQGVRVLFNKGYRFIMVTNNDMKLQEGALVLARGDMMTSGADVLGVPITGNGIDYTLGCCYDKEKKEIIPAPQVTVSQIEQMAIHSPVVDTVYVHGGVILFNRSFFEKIGFYDEYLFFGGDESDFTLRILESNEKIRAVISLRSYDRFDHFTHHDGRFKLLKAKMITQGETYVLMKHGYGLFSAKLHRKIGDLYSELGKGSIPRIVILSFFFLRAIFLNSVHLFLTKKMKNASMPICQTK